jgi:SAM-dependent methyltransferase
MKTKVLPEPVLHLLKQSKQVYSAVRTVRFGIGSMLGARIVPGISGRVHYNDFMLSATDPVSVANYANGAIQFVDILEQALSHCGQRWSDVTSCLEIGSGYGRIIRELRRRLPPENIYACDVIAEGVQFCATEMGVNRADVPGGPNFTKSPTYDLVYLLSVFTHLPTPQIIGILRAIDLAMKGRGILVFTTHGMVSARDRIQRYRRPWSDLREEILAALEKEGSYYGNYSYYKSEYGMAWYTDSFLRDLMGELFPHYELVHYGAAELDEHQDVFVYQKRRVTRDPGPL